MTDLENTYNQIIRAHIQTLVNGQRLQQNEAAESFTALISGEVDPILVSAFLTALQSGSFTPEEIAGAVTALRDQAITIQAPPYTVDCCGTGGDAKHSLNISTAVAFVVAAGGVPVAKHGNRAQSSKSGAADVLEALGVALHAEPDRLSEQLAKIGVCFLFAPYHHPALRHVAPIRKVLKFRTMFNILGPLLNPACVRHQLMGVYDKSLLPLLAQTLPTLGIDSAMLVHSQDGMDEISICAPTDFLRIQQGKITQGVIDPRDFGLILANPQSLTGGDAKENAQALRAIFAGEKNAYADCVALNAAATFEIVGKTPDLRSGYELAQEILRNHRAQDKLEELIAISN